MDERFSRTELLLGKDAMNVLASARVAVFGVGGVGGHTVEALARSGVGAIDIIDNDKVCLSNINRQIIATQSTIGEYKVDVAARRIADINPDCKVTTHKLFYMPDTQAEIDFSVFDYVVDAIDTVTGKLTIILNAQNHAIPVISSMGAGNKIDPTAFEVADIFDTSVCPLAKVMRRELKKRGIPRLKVVYSKEEPITHVEPTFDVEQSSSRKAVAGSTAFVPSVVGLIIAGEVIKDLIAVGKSK